MPQIMIFGPEILVSFMRTAQKILTVISSHLQATHLPALCCG